MGRFAATTRRTVEETRGLLVRDYAYALTKGFGMWWTDLHGGTFHDDRIISSSPN